MPAGLVDRDALETAVMTPFSDANVTNLANKPGACSPSIGKGRRWIDTVWCLS
jgi:hypothetical protein